MSHTIRDKQSLKPEPAHSGTGDSAKNADELHECAQCYNRSRRFAARGKWLNAQVTKGHLTEHRSSGVMNKVKKIWT